MSCAGWMGLKGCSVARLITLTIKAAFTNDEDKSVDTVASRLIEHLLDGLDAEVAFTSERRDVHLPINDPDWRNDESVESWQDKVRAALGGHHG